MKRAHHLLRPRTVAASFAILIATVLSAAAQQAGRFDGDLVAQFLPDGRNMKLERPFSFVDPKGQSWDVPAGAVTDGASIPRLLWVSYPPFTGQYRSAAVIHDHYCQIKSRSWKETHEVFYHAMRAAGVDDKTAKVMYAAVYQFGPRWGIGTSRRGTGPSKSGTPADEKQYLTGIEAWIEKEQPSIEQISKRLDGAR